MTKQKKRGTRHNIRLDQAMQQLFKLSRRVTLRLLNGLFDDHLTEADVADIHYEDTRFTTSGGQQLQGDLYIALRTYHEVRRYHIEFQTLQDNSMAIRMFRYGMEKAIREINAATAEMVIEYPLQRVIYLEENGNIPDELTLRLKFADGQELQYRVPVMKYWQVPAEELLRRGLYALLPLQVFNARVKLKRIVRSAQADGVKQRQIAEQFRELEATIRKTLHLLDDLYEDGELQLDDLEQMVEIAKYIAAYLYAHYDSYTKWHAEVKKLISTWKNSKTWREGEKKGRIQGMIEGKIEGKAEGIEEGKRESARNFLSLGVDPALVRQATGLSEAEIEQLRASLHE